MGKQIGTKSAHCTRHKARLHSFWSCLFTSTFLSNIKEHCKLHAFWIKTRVKSDRILSLAPDMPFSIKIIHKATDPLQSKPNGKWYLFLLRIPPEKWRCFGLENSISSKLNYEENQKLKLSALTYGNDLRPKHVIVPYCFECFSIPRDLAHFVTNAPVKPLYSVKRQAYPGRNKSTIQGILCFLVSLGHRLL